MRRRFFVEKFQDGGAVLQGEAAHHLARVLRAEPGQLYELSDGEALWLARTQDIGRDSIEFALVERLPALLPALHITLQLAIVKFDRFEWAIEKATELGADEIVPLAAERSEKGLVAASAKRAARWKKILVESAQQSRRLRVPVLHDAATPREAFRTDNSQFCLLLSERAGAKPMRELLEPTTPSGQNKDSVKLAIAIGPEGGWTDEEFTVAAECGFAEAALGINILRTETAVCAALAAAQYAFGAFRHTPVSSDSSPDGLPNGSPDSSPDKFKLARAVKEKGSREPSNE
jgi:16S rRNA (uracil1498-N3)-methyltransferase